ncbi:Vacuolar protein sorting/targeting protein 10 [Galdieria sulphuraria]|nr:Vacuolar protein sorting/targeting protein 10 [Galdieria sulphuraria]
MTVLLVCCLLFLLFSIVSCSNDLNIVDSAQLLPNSGSPVQAKYLHAPDGSFTIYLRTEAGKVFRNSLSGKGPWNLQLSEEEYLKGFFAIDLISHPTNPNKLLVVDKKGSFAVTTEALSKRDKLSYDIISVGKDLKGSISVENVKQHPDYPDYLLAAIFAGDCGDLSPSQREDIPFCTRLVYGSNDFGFSWSFLQDFVYDYEFMPTLVVQNCPYVKRRNYFLPFLHRNQPHVVTILTIVSEEDRDKPQDLFSWHGNVELVASVDWFQSKPQLVMSHIYSFAFVGNLLYAAQVDPREHSSVLLKVSKDGGSTFEPVSMPFVLQQQSFHIMSTEKVGGQNALLAVLHGVEDSKPFYNLYLSDSTGTRFSLSLRRAIFEDFSLIRGVQGMMLTNAYDPEASHLDRPRTLLSFDNGGAWHRLIMNESAVPHFYFYKRDVQNNKYYLAPPNSELLLFGSALSNYEEYHFESAYSLNTTSGYILAHGVLLPGPDATLRSDTASLWLSSNGGITWLEISSPGQYIFEYGDYGSLIVYSPMEKTDFIRYSWTGGISWLSISLDKEMFISNILSEPDAVQERMLVLGKRDNDGIVVYIDFGNLNIRPCDSLSDPVTLSKMKPCVDDPTKWNDNNEFHQDKSSDESDYCSFCPADALEGKCPLGRKNCYTRRRAEVLCNNRESFTSRIASISCPCTLDDYQCDIGYERKPGSTECHPSYGTQEFSSKCGYLESKGYVLIPGDTCDVTKGLNLLPSRHSCVSYWIRRFVYFVFWILSIPLVMCCMILLGGCIKGDFRDVSSWEEILGLLIGECRAAGISFLIGIQWIFSVFQSFLENVINTSRGLARGYTVIGRN